MDTYTDTQLADNLIALENELALGNLTPRESKTTRKEIKQVRRELEARGRHDLILAADAASGDDWS